MNEGLGKEECEQKWKKIQKDMIRNKELEEIII